MRIASRFAIVTALVLHGTSALVAAAANSSLQNGAIAWSWHAADGRIRPDALADRLNGGTLPLTGEPFRLELADGTNLPASDFTPQGAPTDEPLAAEPASPIRARRDAGRQVVELLASPAHHLQAEWRALLRGDSTYVRFELTLRATGADVGIKRIVLFEQVVPGASTVGTVAGSPVVAGTFFLGYEHPMARNLVGAGQTVTCAFRRDALLKDGETLVQSAVAGVVPRGQLRRAFLAYVERERAHPYRPFLHYNSWYDIAWDTRKFTEAEGLAAIDEFGRELIVKRGVHLDSFLFDDGWDDNRTLWQFHNGFPQGFTRLQQEAAKYASAPGTWLSPFGGYASAKQQRLKFGRAAGFETNAAGFSLAGPKYYQRFHDICFEMVQKYGVNIFKFDGLAAGGKAAASGLTRDGDAMLRLVAELRSISPNLYVNQTTGTWPSPFWLLYVDSTWRGGQDDWHYGYGSKRQQWITYRDRITHRNVVEAGPLYPLNSIMLHGLIYATYAERLNQANDREFAEDVHAFFGSGTQLQELYLTAGMLDKRNWDDLAEAAKWSRANADVLVDTHWIGGDPSEEEVYGWASWSPRKGILVLRNPRPEPAVFAADVQTLFELPAHAPQVYHLHSPWRADRAQGDVTVRAGEAHTFTLAPFAVVVLESR